MKGASPLYRLYGATRRGGVLRHRRSTMAFLFFNFRSMVLSEALANVGELKG
jgi:hypothetical protein